jgi:hypothetical protein
MLLHSTHTASFFTVLIAVLIFSLSLAGVAAALTTPVWGQTRSLATPRAAPTPPSEPQPCLCRESDQRHDGYWL